MIRSMTHSNQSDKYSVTVLGVVPVPELVTLIRLVTNPAIWPVVLVQSTAEIVYVSAA